jgi:hypothetical protein
MPSLTATVKVSAPAPLVFRYLSERYERPAHLEASMASKGYVAPIRRLECEEGQKLSFSCRGRDPVLRIWIGGWKWSYELASLDHSLTEVTIRYQWSWGMAILAAGTTKHQAANELTETAMALDALSFMLEQG